jgi:tRNA A37 N6-isopentenylltransferase MiaA
MIERGQAATRQLAKRQMTWLRSEQGCHWLDEAAGTEPLALIRSSLEGPNSG